MLRWLACEVLKGSLLSHRCYFLLVLNHHISLGCISHSFMVRIHISLRSYILILMPGVPVVFAPEHWLILLKCFDFCVPVVNRKTIKNYICLENLLAIHWSPAFDLSIQLNCLGSWVIVFFDGALQSHFSRQDSHGSVHDTKVFDWICWFLRAWCVIRSNWHVGPSDIVHVLSILLLRETSNINQITYHFMNFKLIYQIKFNI